MDVSMLDWLRCPFCGTDVELVDSSPHVRVADELVSGVLGCECCAYPVIAGIPVMIADDTTRTAMHQLEAGQGEAALLTLLNLEGERAQAFQALTAKPDQLTYRAAISVLSPDPEGTYFLYRFSDPTYILAQSLLEGLERMMPRTGRAIDLCGGSGHLTRVLTAQPSRGEVVLADVFFWKLWLAKTLTAPACLPVCCDANNPLPFSRDTFQLVVLSDAFPYIWHKRLLAEEMVRLMCPGGAIAMPHLHSSLGENFSAGMTLTPASYRGLFDRAEPRLFDDQTLLDGILDHGVLDLSAPVSAEALGDSPSLTLVASTASALVGRVTLPDPGGVTGELRANPLYRVDASASGSNLTLDFPTEEYEEEFAACKRYLPASVTIPADARGPIDARSLGADLDRLRRSRILLDVPRRYL